jgi:hypothetical protein
MVGYEEGKRHFCGDVPGICSWPQCGHICPSRTCLSERCFAALEGEPFPPDANAKDQAPAKARAKTRLHDQKRSCKVSLVRKTDTPSGEVLSYRVVYGKPPKRHHRTKMVDGES